jgi:hypothetical protein
MGTPHIPTWGLFSCLITVDGTMPPNPPRCRQAYRTGLQHAVADFKDNGKPVPMVPMVLRTTEILRKEGDEWMPIHRHADVQKVLS